MMPAWPPPPPASSPFAMAKPPGTASPASRATPTSRSTTSASGRPTGWARRWRRKASRPSTAATCSVRTSRPRRGKQRAPAYGPLGGETLPEFYERCVGTLTRLAQRHLGQTIVVVAHGGVLDCFYRAANGIELTAPRSWTIGNATINRLLYSPDGLTMVGWADDGHLAASGGVLDESSDGALAPA